jgi:hypothetical protein
MYRNRLANTVWSWNYSNRQQKRVVSMNFVSMFIQQCSIRVEVISNFPLVTIINRSFRCSEDNYNRLCLHSIKYVRLLLKKKRPKRGEGGQILLSTYWGMTRGPTNIAKTNFFFNVTQLVSKVFLLQAWKDPCGSGRLRLSDFSWFSAQWR